MKDFLNRYSGIFRLFLIIFIFLIGFGSYNLYKSIFPTPYISKVDKFQVVFPCFPTVNKLQTEKQSDGSIVSGNVYNCSNQKQGTDYAVYVTNYSGINFSKHNSSYIISTLQEQLEALAKIDSSNISNGQTINFDGTSAVKAIFSPTSQNEAKSYILTLTHNNNLYILIGSGISQNQFNIFTSRFKLLD
jgi:hypothetical protein